MKKIVLCTVIFLFGYSALKAKSGESPKPYSESRGLFSNDELIAKIVSDDNFRKFYIGNVEFANKLIKTKSGKLFLRYVQKNISSDEKILLAEKLGLKSIAELISIEQNLKREGILFAAKFPDLQKLSEKELKDLLTDCIRRISTDKTLMVKLNTSLAVTPEECFWWWMTCNTACVITCSSTQGNNCYWECGAVCAGMYGLCWVWAE